MEFPFRRSAQDNALSPATEEELPNADHDPSNDPDWPSDDEIPLLVAVYPDDEVDAPDSRPSFWRRHPKVTVPLAAAALSLTAFSIGAGGATLSGYTIERDRHMREQSVPVAPGDYYVDPIIGEPHSESQPDGSSSDQIT